MFRRHISFFISTFIKKKKMIALEEALQLIDKHLIINRKETISINECLGRILSMPIIADRDYPPFNRSAMDGIAIRVEDFTDNYFVSKIVETLYAGQKSEIKLGSKESYKIMTGAAVPEFANAVIPRENLIFGKNNFVSFDSLPKVGQNIALQGEDSKFGAILINKNTQINPYIIGLLAALGYDEIDVIKPPRVSIIATGDELVGVKNKPNDFQIRASSLSVLEALLKQNGISNITSVLLVDDKNKIEQSIKNAIQQSDLLLTTGGVSAGDTDFIPSLFHAIGFTEYFHKVAIKPGKPIWVGNHSHHNCTAFGLPGNPISTQIAFVLFIQKWLNNWYGIKPQNPSFCFLNQKVTQNPKLDVFLAAFLENKNGKLYATPIKNNGSGDIISTSFMQGFIKIKKGEGIVNKDEMVEWVG
jgi:molybdopterin molybdotransferase